MVVPHCITKSFWRRFWDRRIHENFVSTHSGDFGEIEKFAFSTFKKTHLSNCPQLGLRQHVAHRKRHRKIVPVTLSKPQKTQKHRRHVRSWIWENNEIRFFDFKNSRFSQIFGFPDLVDPFDLDFAASSHRELHRWWEIRVGTRMNAAKPFNMSAETPWHRIWAPESDGTRPIQPRLHRLQPERDMQEIRHGSGVALWGKAPGGATIYIGPNVSFLPNILSYWFGWL